VVTVHGKHAEKIHKFALKVGVEAPAVYAAIADLRAAEGRVAAEAAAPAPTPSGFEVVLRGLAQPRAEGRVVRGITALAALQAALAIRDYPFAEPVIEWEGAVALAALDLDFHDVPLDQRPSAERLRALAALARPRPASWWVTHGRGLRLVYAAFGGLTASELAACAALGLLAIERLAGAEIVSHTRHPLYARPGHPVAGPIVAGQPTAEVGALARWLGREADEDLVRNWLGERGCDPGHSYEHTRWPIDPGAGSHGEPVFMGDNGIFCHKCAASGVCLGSHRPGFFRGTPSSVAASRPGCARPPVTSATSSTRSTSSPKKPASKTCWRGGVTRRCSR
jgi:hypothetical protein